MVSLWDMCGWTLLLFLFCWYFLSKSPFSKHTEMLTVNVSFWHTCGTLDRESRSSARAFASHRGVGFPRNQYSGFGKSSFSIILIYFLGLKEINHGWMKRMKTATSLQRGRHCFLHSTIPESQQDSCDK